MVYGTNRTKHLTDERVTNTPKYLMNQHIGNEGYVEHTVVKKKKLLKNIFLEEKQIYHKH